MTSTKSELELLSKPTERCVVIGEVKYDSGAEPTLTSIIVAPYWFSRTNAANEPIKEQNCQATINPHRKYWPLLPIITWYYWLIEVSSLSSHFNFAAHPNSVISLIQLLLHTFFVVHLAFLSCRHCPLCIFRRSASSSQHLVQPICGRFITRDYAPLLHAILVRQPPFDHPLWFAVQHKSSVNAPRTFRIFNFSSIFQPTIANSCNSPSA